MKEPTNGSHPIPSCIDTFVWECVYVLECVCVCVCVTERHIERNWERESARKCAWERDKAFQCL